MTTGVYKCSCRTGYEFALGSESICEGINIIWIVCINYLQKIIINSCHADIDECTRNTHNCSLTEGQICQNTPPGSFSCECAPGYNGTNCDGNVVLLL